MANHLVSGEILHVWRTPSAAAKHSDQSNYYHDSNQDFHDFPLSARCDKYSNPRRNCANESNDGGNDSNNPEAMFAKMPFGFHDAPLYLKF